MNLFDFRKLVFSMAQYHGQPYIGFDNVVDLNALLQTFLDDYCKQTGCLSSDVITFTPEVGTPIYDLKDTTFFSSPVCNVRHVLLEGAALPALDSMFPGESSEELAIRKISGYQIAENGRPGYWWLEEPDKLRFSCPFAEVLDDCYLTGNLYHTELDKDQTELDLRQSDIYPAARHCASQLVMVHDLAKGQEIGKVAAKEIEKRTGQTISGVGGSQRRGGSGSRGVDLR